MLVVHVHVLVKPHLVSQFVEATLENAKSSLLEPGIARFDVFQDKSNPASFVFAECYRTNEAPGEHKKTAHYLKWRDTVAEMMAEPRTSSQLANIFPDDKAF